MHLAVYNAKFYDKLYFDKAIEGSDAGKDIEVTYHTFIHSPDTVPLAKGADVVCVFVNDDLPEPILQALYDSGVHGILLR